MSPPVAPAHSLRVRAVHNRENKRHTTESEQRAVTEQGGSLPAAPQLLRAITRARTLHLVQTIDGRHLALERVSARARHLPLLVYDLPHLSLH